MVDNIFYSNDKFDLDSLDLYKRRTHKALLVSYGGYEFFLKNSHLFQKIIAKNTKNIFIFSQTKENARVNISTHKAWSILDSKIDVNTDIIKSIQNLEFINTEDKIIENDHKIEIASNFIKDMTREIKIIPLILGKLNYQALKEFSQFLSEFTKKEENSFLFLSYFTARSTNPNKTIRQAATLKELLLTNSLNSSIILEHYNSNKISPENINAFVIMHKLFQRFEFAHREAAYNDNEHSIIENILIN
ncbi:AmmeMemoRadiSam system protein B [Borrelia sp. BU AG58]|uniref:AmmeMemoRadiSam system protein B n=1 Tax=Borrelia sp. BU AG58 TaxID=2887345 RepID=UPI001E5D329D|nr:AmmeMemoRadiSam system protein B [Borrelia sp. BU AG58]UER67530.1 AmmeMemoRadiSam system protein B [Borrelia sp. BU AG58]